MDYERMLSLAEDIEFSTPVEEATPECDITFDMSTFGRVNGVCGTAACIAGWAVWKYDGVDPGKLRKDWMLKYGGSELEANHPEAVVNRAQRILGLSDEEASYLFLAEWMESTGNDLSGRAAAHIMRMMALHKGPVEFDARLPYGPVNYRPEQDEDY